MGVPVILTDPAGRDPMVVLTLEQFEAMNGEPPARPRPTPPVRSAPRTAPVQEPVVESPAKAPIRLADDREADARAEEALKAFETMAGSYVENDEIPLEERFYLEPVDDGDQA